MWLVSIFVFHYSTIVVRDSTFDTVTYQLSRAHTVTPQFQHGTDTNCWNNHSDHTMGTSRETYRHAQSRGRVKGFVIQWVQTRMVPAFTHQLVPGLHFVQQICLFKNHSCWLDFVWCHIFIYFCCLHLYLTYFSCIDVCGYVFIYFCCLHLHPIFFVAKHVPWTIHWLKVLSMAVICPCNCLLVECRLLLLEWLECNSPRFTQTNANMYNPYQKRIFNIHYTIYIYMYIYMYIYIYANTYTYTYTLYIIQYTFYILHIHYTIYMIHYTI